MKSVALSGNKRAERGTSNANILRKEEKVPAVILRRIPMPWA